MIQTNSRKCVPNSHSFHIIYNQSETQTGINTIPSFVCVPMETSIGISIEKNTNPDVLKLVCIKKSMSTIKIQSLLFPTSWCWSTSFVCILGCNCCATGHCWAIQVAVAETLNKCSCDVVTSAGLFKPEDDHYDCPKQSCSDLRSDTSDITPLFKEEFYGFHLWHPWDTNYSRANVCWHWLKKLI